MKINVNVTKEAWDKAVKAKNSLLAVQFYLGTALTADQKNALIKAIQANEALVKALA